MTFRTLLFRACRLRCPLCGQGRLFAGPWRMNRTCSHCGATFEREAGFFLGSIYFNYGLTALLVTITYMALFVKGWESHPAAIAGTIGFTLLFPLWFHRYARSLWLGFDQFMDPRHGNPSAGE